MYLNEDRLIEHYLSKDTYKTIYQSNFKRFRRFYFLFNFSKTIFFEWIKIKHNKFDLKSCQLASLKLLNYLEKVGFKFEIIGLRNLYEISNPCIFVANHMSMIETFVLPGLLMQNVKLSIIAKNELKKYLFLSSILNFIQTIFISRKNRKDDLAKLQKESSKLIKNKFSLLIFPQSTRCKEFDPKSFRKIGLRIAYDNNICLMPIAVKSDAWGLGKLIKDFGKFDINKTIYISFGELIYPNKYSLYYHEVVIKFITKSLNDWKFS